MTDTISSTQFRDGFSQVIDRIQHKGERLVLTRNGHAACAMVSLDDLKLLECIEDEHDIILADRAMEEDDGNRTSLADARKQLGF